MAFSDDAVKISAAIAAAAVASWPNPVAMSTQPFTGGSGAGSLVDRDRSARVGGGLPRPGGRLARRRSQAVQSDDDAMSLFDHC
ncbi:hypothetical protein Vau01_122500 [Virgisporangium aurantiacum]|uniref:Uncharacterized protein n=1 Tax=Virgisporangium aurantiacum TaxID=175570 RepID=A0A8J4E7W2_9ACTN|nr:hypothetical protein Vau01_122500 [Virgisporangium aurantiacum]